MNRSLKLSVFAALVFFAGAFSAFGQSAPSWSYGYVPTPQEWQYWWSHKMDYNGVSPCLLSGCTLSGRLVTQAPTTNAAGFNLAPGTSPTSPINGDLWVTSAGIFAQINGATVQLTGGGGTIGPGGANQIAYYSAASTINGIAAAANGVLVTNGSNVPSISSTLPSGIAATNMNLTTPTLGVAAGTSLALGGATIGTNALAVTGTSLFNSGATFGAAITYGGVTLANSVTGTGSLVLSTSPSLTTPTLGVAAGTSLALGGCSIGTNQLCAGSSSFGGQVVVASASASALAVGLNGATNPALEVDASTASSATGVAVKSAAAGSGATIKALSSATNEPLFVDAKGNGELYLGDVSTGGVSLAQGGTGVYANGFLDTVSTSSNALTVGPNGITNPALQVDASTASSATGVNIKSAAAGGGIAVSAISSGTNESLTLNAKGSGTINIGGVSTGAVSIGGGGGGLTVSGSLTATGLVTYADIATAGLATSSQYISGASSVLVPASVAYTAETTTTFGATTTFDFSTFINTAVTLTGNITTMSVANVKAGQAGEIRFIQDATGSRTTVWNSVFKFAGGTTPTLSTGANDVDVLFYSCVSTTACYASLSQNMK